MRQLVLLRGPMGVGKSTWVKENGLEQYTLSADEIRLLFQSPVMDENGGYSITQKNDDKVWKFLFELLEERMKRGEFTIIDATHSKTSMISRYKTLAQKYRYRVTVVDFSDVPLDVVLERNMKRPEYKRVPELAILNAYERMSTERVPSWVTVVKPHEFKEHIQYLPINFDEYRKIHVIGDIQGCYTVLQQYLNGGLKDDELYIFVGDLLDRGIENAKVLQFMIEIKDKKNVIILEGNHEHHLRLWAHDEPAVSKVFETQTQPELEAAGIDKKEVRQLCRKLNQIAYFTYHGKKFIVTHGGISSMPENLMFIATEQFIKGVGDYELDIDYIFSKNTDDSIYQIHGHRNMFRLPTHAARNSYNLEGQVEKGGYMRVVTITPDSIETHEIKNNVFKTPEKKEVVLDETKITIEEFLEHLQDHDYINEKKLGNNISSFNFTRKAFTEKVWDDVSVKARGLFINTNTKEIVSRSYNKFFNVNERSFTKLSALADSLKFPITVYDKPNGYLGTIGYNSEFDELVFTSKSEIKNEFALWFKELFYQKVTPKNIEYVKQYVKDNKVSLVFEVILPEKDPHIIEYPEDKFILLDIVKRDIVYSKLEYEKVVELGSKLGIEYKKLVKTFDNWTDFYRWYQQVTQDFSIVAEGYVIEDSSGFMTKIKLPYYNFWKQMRGLKDKIGKKHEHMVNSGGLYTPLHNKFYAWMKTKDRNYLLKSSIIKLRNEFYKETSSN